MFYSVVQCAYFSCTTSTFLNNKINNMADGDIVFCKFNFWCHYYGSWWYTTLYRFKRSF